MPAPVLLDAKRDYTTQGRGEQAGIWRVLRWVSAFVGCVGDCLFLTGRYADRTLRSQRTILLVAVCKMTAPYVRKVIWCICRVRWGFPYRTLRRQDATQSTHHVNWCGLQDDRTLRKKSAFVINWCGLQDDRTLRKKSAFVGCVGVFNAPLRKKGYLVHL